MKTRIHTVVWGVLLVGIAALFLVGTLVDLSLFNPAVVVAVAVASLGTLLVLGGAAAALIRASRR